MLKFGVPTGQEWMDALIAQEFANFSTGSISTNIPQKEGHTETFGPYTVVFYSGYACIYADEFSGYFAHYTGKSFLSSSSDIIPVKEEVQDKLLRFWIDFKKRKAIQIKIVNTFDALKLKEQL